MPDRATAEGGRTRRGLLRGAAAGGLAAAGGAAVISRGGGAIASPSLTPADARILNLLLVLERLQRDFYRAALERAGLTGELQRFAQVAATQEGDHIAGLTRRLGSQADAPPRTDVSSAVTSPRAFQRGAIELEEAAIATYVGQGANLSRHLVAGVAVLTSVEARQAAWIRDIAGMSPAPRAADPARSPRAVLADLRKEGWLQ